MNAPDSDGTGAGTIPPVTLFASPRAAAVTLLMVVSLLVSVHTLVMVAKFGFGHDHLMGMTRLFDLNEESNVPTWYSAVALLLCAIALTLITEARRRAHAPFVTHWAGLAVLFGYMSLDEIARLHEHWGVVVDAPLAWMRRADVAGGVFRNLWVVPAAVVAAIVGLTYLRFLWHLPLVTRRSFALAGAVFVFASVGLEMVGASYTAHGGRRLPLFAVLVTIEEILEMGSIVLFLWAALGYLRQTVGSIQLRFDAPSKT